jgi:hypothetical protein
MRNMILIPILSLACDQGSAEKATAKADKRGDLEADAKVDDKATVKAAAKRDDKVDAKAEAKADAGRTGEGATACTTLPGSLVSSDGEKLVDLAMVYRHSTTKDASGIAQPPWSYAYFIAYMAKPIACGEKVTALALTGWAPSTVEVVAVESSESDNVSYGVTARSTDKDFLEGAPQEGRSAELPTDVVVLFPASDKARLLPTSASPAGLKAKGKLTAVVDVDGNGDADVAFSAKPLGDLGDCTYTYQREGTAWKQVEELCPD